METEIYIRLFLIVPLLVYTGTCILTRHTHMSTLMFHGMVLMTIALTLFFHLRYLFRVIRRIFQKEIYQKEFGAFLLMLAVFLVALSVHDIIHNGSIQMVRYTKKRDRIHHTM